MNCRQAGEKIVNEKFYVFRKVRAVKMLKTKIENKYVEKQNQKISSYHMMNWKNSETFKKRLAAVIEEIIKINSVIKTKRIGVGQHYWEKSWFNW